MQAITAGSRESSLGSLHIDHQRQIAWCFDLSIFDGLAKGLRVEGGGRGYMQSAGPVVGAGCLLMQRLASTSRCLDETKVCCARGVL